MRHQQRRWVLKRPPSVEELLKRASVHTRIEDAYPVPRTEELPTLRFRRIERVLYDGTPGSTHIYMTVRGRIQGNGIREDIESMLPENAEPLFRAVAKHASTLRKQRFMIANAYYVDVYEHPVHGLTTLECRVHPEDAVPEVPTFAIEWNPVDVTETLTALHIAQLPGLGEALDPMSYLLTHHGKSSMPMIVITGGPCAGKTTFLDMLRSDHRFHIVPETATIFISELQCPPSDQPEVRVRFQLHLRNVQMRFEAMACAWAREAGKLAVILDRGTVDALAYLDGGSEQYFRLFGISPEQDASRYSAVIHLASPSKEVYTRHHANNPARGESYREARKLGRRIADAWNFKGPSYAYVGENASCWEEKRDHAMSALEEYVASR